MGWTLNKLEKTSAITYIPGVAGVVGQPGRPAIEEYSYYETETVPGYFVQTSLPPTHYGNIIYNQYGQQIGGSGGYRFFDGVQGNIVQQENYGGIFIYVYAVGSQVRKTLITVPGSPAIPPTPSVPATASQTLLDNRLGWNSGALGPTSFLVNKILKWRFSSGSVGAIVGLSHTVDPQDQSYPGMELAVMATSGLFAVYKNGSKVTSSRPFTSNDVFVLRHTAGGKIEFAVSGGVFYETTVYEPVVADSSLYSAGDVIWDIQEGGLTLAPINAQIGAITESNAVAVFGKVSVVKTFGPGTALGVIGSVTRSNAQVGAIKINGVVHVAVNATTETHAEGLGYPVKTVGQGTGIGAIASVTESNAEVSAISEPTGSADLSFKPLSMSGSGPNVNDGWTGDFVGDSLNMLPADIEASAGLAEPSIGIGSMALVPLTNTSTGLTGEISTSSDCQMMPMLAMGSGHRDIDPPIDYAQGISWFAPLTLLGSDDASINGGTVAFGISFLLDARGWSQIPNGSYLRVRDAFSASGQGGHQAKDMRLRLALEASGVGEGIGVFEGVIGYA